MIYAINNRTKEHVSVPRVISDPDWYFVEADADGWIPWEGGECPLPSEVRVRVRTRNGVECPLPVHTGNQRWGHGGGQYDIIAYRPILGAEPSEPEAPEWPQPGDKAELHNDPGYAIAYGDSAIGEEVEVLAVFYSDAIKMAAVEHDGSCYCFRADMLRPIRSEEDRLIEEAMSLIGVEPDEHGAESVVFRMIRAGYRKTGDE